MRCVCGGRGDFYNCSKDVAILLNENKIVHVLNIHQANVPCVDHDNVKLFNCRNFDSFMKIYFMIMGCSYYGDFTSKEVRTCKYHVHSVKISLVSDN